MIFVYDVEYYLNVCPVSEQSFSQIWSDLKDKKSGVLPAVFNSSSAGNMYCEARSNCTTRGKIPPRRYKFDIVDKRTGSGVKWTRFKSANEKELLCKKNAVKGLSIIWMFVTGCLYNKTKGCLY